MPTRSPLRPWHSRQPGTGPSRPRVPSFSRGPAAGCGAGGGVAAAQGTGLVGHWAGGPPAPSARGRAWGETSKVREKQIKLFPFSRNNCLPNCCCNYCPTGKQRERKALQGEAGKLEPGGVRREVPPTCPHPRSFSVTFPQTPGTETPPQRPRLQTPEARQSPSRAGAQPSLTTATARGWGTQVGTCQPPPWCCQGCSSVAALHTSHSPELPRKCPGCTETPAPRPAGGQGLEAKIYQATFFLLLSPRGISSTQGMIAPPGIVLHCSP